MNIWTRTLFGNTLFQWSLALIVGIIVYGFLHLLAWLLRRKIGKVAQQPELNTGVLIKNLLDKTSKFFFI